MKEFEFEGPDGKTHVIEGPDNATPEQAFAMLQRQLAKKPAPGRSDMQVAAMSSPVLSTGLEAVKNIPGSAANLGGAILQAVSSPKQTVLGLWDAAAGGLQNILAPENFRTPQESILFSPRAERTASAVGQFYKDRYGGLSNTGQTISKDPVGFLADVAAVTGIAGSGLRAVGATKAGQAATQVSRAVDPLMIAGRSAKSVVKPAYTYLTGQTTGSGAVAATKALEGGKGFTDALRGKISEAQVLDDAQGALGEIVRKRGADYRAKLASLKSSRQRINIDDVKQAADNWLSEMGVKKTPTGLDFSKSRVTGSGVQEVTSVYDDIVKWGSDPADLTPVGLDTLKQRLAKMYKADSNSRAMVSDLRDKVEKKIINAVPQYKQMTKDYAEASDLIREMESAVGLNNKTAANTTLRKLLTAIREDKTYRRTLIDQLSQAGNVDIAGEVAGLAMKPTFSNRLGTLVATGSGVGLAAGVHPALAGVMALGSPRLVAEVSLILGRLARATSKARGTGITAYQAGRLPFAELQAEE